MHGYMIIVYILTHTITLPRGSSAFFSLPRVAVSKELEFYRRSLDIHKFIYTHIYIKNLDPLKKQNDQGKINKPRKQGEHSYGAGQRRLLRFARFTSMNESYSKKAEKKKHTHTHTKKTLHVPEHAYAPTSPLGLTPSTSHATFLPPKGGAIRLFVCLSIVNF